jgi:hypothetical protein
MSDTNRSGSIGSNAADLKAMGDTARQVGDKAALAGSDAVQQAKEVAGDAQDRASSLLGAATQKASSVAEAQKENVAGYIDDVAKAVHRSGEQLEGHQDWVAHMVERGAAELSSLANTLRTNDLQSLMGDLGSLARRQPALFVGATMAAGFALARVGRLAASGGTASPDASPETAPAAAPPSNLASSASSDREATLRHPQGYPEVQP